MFDFSFAELLLVIVVAVIFIGPKELPVVVRAVAKAIRAVRSFTKEVRSTIDQLAEESGVKDTIESLDKEVKFIRGDDGTMYESYDVSKVLGGESDERK